ncbi:MAG: hypothetical protein M1820_010059 [Bogoriella megaspora]|nr:MAG: hypothetical protein M1820_010059 [Bogoriella megaspora]
MTGARWDDVKQRWNIFTREGLLTNSQFFLPCSGYSTIRHIPDFPGLGTFHHRYHISEWPESLEFQGKRVAVIVTAASGIQVIEALREQVSYLTVFQRTPNLATPMRQKQFTASDILSVKQEYPQLFASRISRNGFLSQTHRKSAEDTIDESEEFLEGVWKRGGMAFWFDNYEDMLGNPAANDLVYNFWRKKVHKRVHNAGIAEKLAPSKAPHAFGTKRPSLETAYFEVFNQSNVSLVDVNSDPITQVTPEGIYTASGAYHRVDIIALATGFDFITGSMLAMGIRGVNGRRLDEKWDISVDGEGVSTHLGLMTAGFPNMFFPMGPQAPSALGLTPHMAEVQGDWIAECLAYMRRKGLSVIQPTEDAELE